MKLPQLLRKLLLLVALLPRALATKRRQNVIRRIDRITKLSVHVLGCIDFIVQVTQRERRRHGRMDLPGRSRLGPSLLVIDLLSMGLYLLVRFSKVGDHRLSLHRLDRCDHLLPFPVSWEGGT